MPFIYFLLFTFCSFSAEIYMSKPREDDGFSGPSYVIKTLEDIKTPKWIIITDDKDNHKKKPEEQTTISQDNQLTETRIEDKKNPCENGECTKDTKVTGTMNNNENEPFCKIYDKKLYNVVEMYKNQIDKMTAISDKTTPQMTPQKYLCRAFSNIMLIDEGVGPPNKTYIENAKKDVKIAIEKNEQVGIPYRINTIDDKMLSEIFRKYGEVVMKDMKDDDKQIVQDAIQERNLYLLQVKTNEHYNYIDSIAGTEGTTKDKSGMDLSPYYTPEMNNVLKEFDKVNPHGNIEEETTALRLQRATKEGMQVGESRVDDMMQAILLIDEGGKGKW